MKISTIIVDDEAPARRRIRQLLEREPKCDVIGEAENGRQAVELIKAYNPDLLLLDIQLKDMTGFEVLRTVVNSFEGMTIFITAYDQYAIQAFEAKAIDYLLKPFKNARFGESIQRAINLIEIGQQPSMAEFVDFLDAKKQQPSLRITEGRVSHHMDSGDLIFVRSEGYYCHFRLNKKTKMIRVSLKQTEEQLPNHFVRINRSTIVNLKKISSTKQLKNNILVTMITDDEFTAFQNLEMLG